MRRASDWPFCHSRQNKITAVVWSKAASPHYGYSGERLTPTKAKAERAIRNWKRWKERQGWTVYKLDTGYSAGKGDLREWCGLHVYDFNTRERIN